MKHTFLFALLLALFLPLPMQAIDFDPNMRYSHEVIDACLYHFNANGKAAGFAQYDANGTLIEPSESSRGFDYVPGLVAKAVLEAIDYYQDSAFVKPWYYSMAAYGNKYVVGRDARDHSKSTTLDDLNACKLYFGLSDLSKPGAKFANATTYANCQTAKTSTLKGLENYDQKYSISSEISQAFCGDDTYTGAGGIKILMKTRCGATDSIWVLPCWHNCCTTARLLPARLTPSAGTSLHASSR